MLLALYISTCAVNLHYVGREIYVCGFFTVVRKTGQKIEAGVEKFT